MESCVKDFLAKKGYDVNDHALTIIKVCDDWYANRLVKEFHKRRTVQGSEYELNRLGMAKRCCADDANLCEVVEINAGKNKEQFDYVNEILRNSNFDTNYRGQLERVSGKGTAACYVRVDNVTFMKSGKTQGGTIKLNYVDAEGYMPLTIDNGIVEEAAFSGNSIYKGKKRTTLVLFLKSETGTYVSETHVFDEFGNEQKELEVTVNLGDVKPFAVMRNAEVNNLDDMDGYGLPKILNAIPILEGIDLCYNILFGDLDKGEKLMLVNELLCKFDENGQPIAPNEQIKKIFVLLGEEKLPQEKSLVYEYNPEIRIDQITKTFELLLSLLSNMFGYGTKKYSFENGQITTATEYIGERQDSMQELNRQRFEATQYITDIVKAVMWFSNTFLGTSWNVDEEITIEFDDSYIEDKTAKREQMRSDALSFDIPKLTIWYLMDAYNLTEEEATALVEEKQKQEEEMDNEDDPQD